MKPTVGLLIKKYTMKWDIADKYTEHLILTDTWQDLQSPWRQFPGSICKSVSKRSNWNKKAYPKCGCSPSQGVECQTEFKSEQTTPQRPLSASCLWVQCDQWPATPASGCSCCDEVHSQNVSQNSLLCHSMRKVS